jgi:hypothetical protein
MKTRRREGWLPREGSWEEAVFGWHEQMEHGSLRQHGTTSQTLAVRPEAPGITPHGGVRAGPGPAVGEP